MSRVRYLRRRAPAIILAWAVLAWFLGLVRHARDDLPTRIRKAGGA